MRSFAVFSSSLLALATIALLLTVPSGSAVQAQNQPARARRAAAVEPAALPASWPIGVKPQNAEGKELNLDFEAGDLSDWTATGDAFARQPIAGDTVVLRKPSERSGHVGRYWIGGYERAGDRPQGTLTSAPIKVSHPFASFLVGGGSHEMTSVELILKSENPSANGSVVFKAAGQNNERMRPVVANLKPYYGEEVIIRLTDKHSGGWGHINFDHFRFHAENPRFPQVASQSDAPVFTYAGLDAETAAEAMTLPDGFRASVVAAEPDVQQPIAFTIDDRAACGWRRRFRIQSAGPSRKRMTGS